MGRGVGDRNIKERLTKKRERENYRKELTDIKADLKAERESFKAAMRSGSSVEQSVRSGSIAGTQGLRHSEADSAKSGRSGSVGGGSPRVGKYDFKNGLNHSEREYSSIASKNR